MKCILFCLIMAVQFWFHVVKVICFHGIVITSIHNKDRQVGRYQRVNQKIPTGKSEDIKG